MHINDRAKDNIIRNKIILKDFDYTDIEYFDGNSNNGHDVLKSMSIKTDAWKPYDGRDFPPMPGEYGLFVSFLNLLNFIVKSSDDNFLLVEDDVILDENFVDYFNLCLMDLPDSYDFLSFGYSDGQNEVTENTKINSSYIHKSYNQFSGHMVMLFSKNGAKKILKILKRVGMEYNIDCMTYRYSLIGALEGYSVVPLEKRIVTHPNIVESTIDPENKRNTNNKII